MKKWLKVKSFGGANSVTGSCHEITQTVDGYDYKYLVDCGLFQGQIARKHPELNFNLRGVVDDVNAVFITHAHIDHIGRIPVLNKWGYGGKIYATEAVCELAKPVLEDSAKIQKEEYYLAVKKEIAKSERGEEFHEVELLYEVDDVYDVIEQLEPVKRDEEIVINQYLTVVFYDAGHSLGSSSIKMIFNNGEETFTMLFSGDLGNENNPILKQANMPYMYDIDAVFTETTYAGRFHASQEENWNEVRKGMAEALQKGGKVLLPAFAVGRTQELLYILFKDMMENDDEVVNIFKETNIYVDSVLAVRATKIFEQFKDEFNSKAAGYMAKKRNNPFDFPNLHLIGTKEESIALCASDEPAIIFSASGMCDAGRVIYHLREVLDNPNCAVVLTGFQEVTTLGRRILDGEKVVNVAKKECHVLAKILVLNSFSAHADQNGIIKWLNNIEPGYMLFLGHGEKTSQNEFMKLLKSFYSILAVNTLDLDTEYVMCKGYLERVTIEAPLKQKKKKEVGKDDKLRLARLYDQLAQIEEELGEYSSCEGKLVLKIKGEIRKIKEVARKNSCRSAAKTYFAGKM